MGLYDGKSRVHVSLPEFKFDFEWRKLKYPALGLAALLVVLFFAFSIALLVQPKAIEASLSPNPLDLAKEQDSFLTVTINNVTDSTASNIVVSVETSDQHSILIFPKSQEIATLGKGETRTLLPFAVSPNPVYTVYSGTYILTIKTAINGQTFSKQVALQLKAV